jgi:hypothetical protein
MLRLKTETEVILRKAGGNEFQSLGSATLSKRTVTKWAQHFAAWEV